MRAVNSYRRVFVDSRYARELEIQRQADGLITAHDLWIEDDLDRHWRVGYRIAVQDGALIVAELRVLPAENHEHRPRGSWSAEVLGAAAHAPRGGVRVSSLLRAVKITEALKKAVPLFRALKSQEADFFRGPGALVSPLVDLPDEPRRGRRRPRVPDRLLRRIAAAYRVAATKDRRRVNVLVAERLGMKPARVRDLVHLARGRGLLPKSSRGVVTTIA
jgi:hypothetical protein